MIAGAGAGGTTADLKEEDEVEVCTLIYLLVLNPVAALGWTVAMAVLGAERDDHEPDLAKAIPTATEP